MIEKPVPEHLIPEMNQRMFEVMPKLTLDDVGYFVAALRMGRIVAVVDGRIWIRDEKNDWIKI